jgi:hypothetical protein
MRQILRLGLMAGHTNAGKVTEAPRASHNFQRSDDADSALPVRRGQARRNPGGCEKQQDHGKSNSIYISTQHQTTSTFSSTMRPSNKWMERSA